MACGIRIGQGYDVHKLVEGRPLVIGGVNISHTHGLLGHSDADVAIHALCDAILGAAAMRDIGYHFPDTAGEFKDIDSRILLMKVCAMVREAGWEISNVDVTVCAQRPKLSPHIPAMISELAMAMTVEESQVSVKATTTERLGFEGREEGISAMAVALLYDAKSGVGKAC